MTRHLLTFLVAFLGMLVAYGAVQIGSDLWWLHQVRRQNQLEAAARQLIQQSQQTASPSPSEP